MSDPGSDSSGQSLIQSSSSRSLTTLIRDLHAEFPELDDIDDDSWAQSLAADEEKVPDKITTLPTPVNASSSSNSVSSLLCELELLAASVKALPVPRPPSLSSADWKSALVSPDTELFAYSLFDEQFPQDLTVAIEEHGLIRPPLAHQSALMDVDLYSPVSSCFSLDSPLLEPERPAQAYEKHVPPPSRSRSLKNVLSFKRAAATGHTIASTPTSISRSRGLTYPNFNARPRIEMNSPHSSPVEPVSFLLF